MGRRILALPADAVGKRPDPGGLIVLFLTFSFPLDPLYLNARKPDDSPINQRDEMMNEGNHTPGPWNFGPSKYNVERLNVQAGMPSMRILASFDGDGDGYDETDEANARLIAAAPDLLEALTELLRISRITSVYVCGEGSDEESSDLEAAIKEGAAAIARATQGDTTNGK